MIKQLRLFVLNVIAGVNVAVVATLLLAGYSDRVSPAAHPLVACLGMALPVLAAANLALLFFWLAACWRRAWIPVAGFVLAYIPISTYLPLNPRQDVPADATKVISYNVCTYGGNYKYKDAFERILAYIDRQQPDIVCLQEDVDSWRRYAMQKFSQVMPYNDTTVFVNDASNFNAVGLHTRYPILHKERISFTSRANGAVAYYLRKGSDTLLVVNCHLECTRLTKEERSNYKGILRGDIKGDTARTESRLLLAKLSRIAALRAPQAEAVHRYVEAHRQYPTIVCGDFNDTPISYTHHTVGQGLTDCFRASGRGVGVSYNQKGFWVRIDHVFCSPHFTPYNCQVDAETDFSDHYPVLCWLKMDDKLQKNQEKCQ